MLNNGLFKTKVFHLAQNLVYVPFSAIHTTERLTAAHSTSRVRANTYSQRIAWEKVSLSLLKITPSNQKCLLGQTVSKCSSTEKVCQFSVSFYARCKNRAALSNVTEQTSVFVKVGAQLADVYCTVYSV